MTDPAPSAVPETQRKLRSVTEPETSITSIPPMANTTSSTSTPAESRAQQPLYQPPRGPPSVAKKGKKANKANPGERPAQSGSPSNAPSDLVSTITPEVALSILSFMRQQETTNQLFLEQLTSDKTAQAERDARHGDILLGIQNEMRGRSVSRGRSHSQRTHLSHPAELRSNSELRQAVDSDPHDSSDDSSIDDDGNNEPLAATSHYQHKKDRYRPNNRLELLDDGKVVKYFMWKLQIEGLFNRYPQDFRSLHEKLLLILGATTGRAQRRLSHRLKPTSPLYFRNIAEVWKVLEETCVDPHEARTASSLFKQLHMKDFSSFADFLVEFENLAEISETPLVKRREELWDRITYSLKASAIPTENLYHSYRSLAKNLGRIDLESRDNDNQYKRSRPTLKLKAGVLPAQKPTYVPGSYIPAVAGPATRRETPRQATPRATPDPDHTRLQCYNCREYGHISTNCDKAPKVSNIDLEAELHQNDESWYPESSVEIKEAGKDHS